MILLRRNALQDYPAGTFSFSERVDQLLSGKEHFIRIRDEFKQEAVLHTSSPRGLKTTNKPLSGGSLSDYLSRRALRAGYGPGVTIYAFRRKAASEWTRQVGLTQAKSLMAHAPNSIALQKHYEQGFFDLDVTAIALREDPSANLADMDADASPALTRLVDFTRAEGAWLDNYVETLGQKSKPLLETIKQGDAAKAAKIRRRIRSYARLALIEEQKVNQAAKLTQAEFERRKEELAKPMMLFRMIEERASALMRGGKNIKDVLDADQDLLVPEDLHDIEEEGAAVQGSIIVDEDTGPDDQTIVTYEFAASLFMLTALEGYKIVGEDGSKQKCHLCLADSTMSAETKVSTAHIPIIFYTVADRHRFQNKLWKPAYLKEHIASSIHSKKRTWLRGTQQLYEESNAEKYFCTYGDCKAEYKTLSRLVNHIKTSNAENESQAHDDFKRADGWTTGNGLCRNIIAGEGPNVSPLVWYSPTRRNCLGLSVSSWRNVPQHHQYYWLVDPTQRFNTCRTSMVALSSAVQTYRLMIRNLWQCMEVSSSWEAR